MSNQLREQAELSKVFAEDTEKVEILWRRRVKEYEEAFAKSVDDFHALHEEQQQQLNEQLRHNLQLSPRPSKVRSWLCACSTRIPCCVCHGSLSFIISTLSRGIVGDHECTLCKGVAGKKIA